MRVSLLIVKIQNPKMSESIGAGLVDDMLAALNGETSHAPISQPWGSSISTYTDDGYSKDIMELMDPKEKAMQEALGEYEAKERMISLNADAKQLFHGIANTRAELKQHMTTMLNLFPVEDDDSDNLSFIETTLPSAEVQCQTYTMVFHLVCRIADPPLILASLALKARALVSMNDYSGGLACAAAATLVLRPGTYDLFEMMEIAKMPVTRDNDTPSVSFQ